MGGHGHACRTQESALCRRQCIIRGTRDGGTSCRHGLSRHRFAWHGHESSGTHAGTSPRRAQGALHGSNHGAARFVATRSAQVAGDIMSISLGGSSHSHSHSHSHSASTPSAAASSLLAAQSMHGGAAATSASAATTPKASSSSFLSQIGLVSGPSSNIPIDEVRDSFVGSMTAMIAQQKAQAQASSYASGANAALGGRGGCFVRCS